MNPVALILSLQKIDAFVSTTPAGNAVLKFPPVAEALRTLEEAIVGRYGKKQLAALQKKEASFKERVVDPERHEGLDNPYDLPIPLGMLTYGVLLIID